MPDIYLYVYDMTKGAARHLSPVVLGWVIDGIWHIGVVAFEKEWFFGSDGVESCKPVTKNTNWILKTSNFKAKLFVS